MWQHGAYRERVYQRAAGGVQLGITRLSAAALVDSRGDAYLAFADARVRVVDTPEHASWLDLRTGGRLQRDNDDRVTQLVGEVEIAGRLALGSFDRAMRSNFVELSSGIALDRVTYNAMTSEVDSILLGTFAWGMYLPGGELRLYYDHRRDGLAGGIDAWRASGYFGSFGAALDLAVDGPWALRGDLQVGNSYLTTLAIAYRGGSR